MAGRHGSRQQACVVSFLLAGALSLGKDALAEPPRKAYTRHRNPLALPVDKAAAEAEPPQRWYGWQILIADGSATSLLLVDAALTDGEPALALGLLFYVSPILHAVHGNPGRAAASLGLRALLPFAGGMIAMESSNDCGLLGGSCEGLGVGVGLGYATAVLIDAGLLGWEEDDAPDADASSLRPAVDVGWNRVLLGVAGEL
jgi:hypothetical protein